MGNSNLFFKITFIFDKFKIFIMKKILFILLTLVAFSCSKDDVQNQQKSEEFNVADLRVIIEPSECSGYGLFENKEYDCGWKTGYDDWVAHYNAVVNARNYPECYEIRLVSYTSNGENHVTLEWQTVNNSMEIIEEAQNNNWTYYNNLYSITNPTDRELGQQAGYSAGRGKQPFAANDSESCD